MAPINHRDIVALQGIKGCGLAAVRKICDVILNRDVEIARPSDLSALIGDLVRAKILNKMLSGFDSEDATDAYRQADSILLANDKLGIQIVSAYDDAFPEMLKGTVNDKGAKDVPVLLYYKGDIRVASMPSIAVIGSRDATDASIQASMHFSRYFAGKGFNITSGLAVGCDSSAHRGALDAKGKTTAFLANGLDTIFPQENTALAESILYNGGLLMSEYPVGTPAAKYNLVARDRLQAGLSIATIVIQTSIHGGTMHAATATLLAGKPLYAVKFNDMTSDNVKGNLSLVSRGAKYITSANKSEILDSLSELVMGDRPGEPFKTTLF